MLCKCFTPPQLSDAQSVLEEQSRMSGATAARRMGGPPGQSRAWGGPTLGDARKAALNCAAYRLGQCYVSEGIDTMQKKKERRWSSDGR